ncbi:MAG: class I SAM-dependent methyltransferase [Bacillota bacterium]
MCKQTSWSYNEMRQIGTDYFNIEEVRKYDRRMQKIRDVPKEVKHILEIIDAGPGQNILEFGTGTGEFAIAAATKCSKVYALDISAVMLDYARQKAESLGLNNIIFQQAGFLTYQHREMPLDAVVTQLALHHLPDFWKFIALRNIYGFLKTGGKLYLRDVVFDSGVENYNEYFGGWRDSVLKMAGEEFSASIDRHIRDEYSTLDWVMEGMITRAGFEIDKVYQPGYCNKAYLCVKSG